MRFLNADQVAQGEEPHQHGTLGRRSVGVRIDQPTNVPRRHRGAGIGTWLPNLAEKVGPSNGAAEGTPSKARRGGRELRGAPNGAWRAQPDGTAGRQVAMELGAARKPGGRARGRNQEPPSGGAKRRPQGGGCLHYSPLRPEPAAENRKRRATQALSERAMAHVASCPHTTRTRPIPTGRSPRHATLGVASPSSRPPRLGTGPSSRRRAGR